MAFGKTFTLDSTKKIRIYTAPTCIYCHALMDWLDDLGATYEEIDASGYPDISTVPVTIIVDSDGNETRIVGFDRPKLKRALRA